ncbi:pyridoxal phosphate-dependent transferase [Auriculariales sp. MPI-PUGE-AT-0066]|nr:pyridoxal phosphate-dependent transferase [Auriculariales sp. MPI-PUGE-AT-0066]
MFAHKDLRIYRSDGLLHDLHSVSPDGAALFPSPFKAQIMQLDSMRSSSPATSSGDRVMGNIIASPLTFELVETAVNALQLESDRVPKGNKADTLRLAIDQTLQSRLDRGIFRRLCASEDRNLVDFSSNDFLSLATNETLKQDFLRCLSIEKEPILGASGSRLLIPAPHHVALEARISRIWMTPNGAVSSLAFATGYAANVALWSTLPQHRDIVLYDELVHASVHDGIRMGRVGRGTALAVSFPHNDLGVLRPLLEEEIARDRRGFQPRTVFVAVESLYSMDGDTAPLVEIIRLLKPLGSRAKLIVDEAHAVGVFNRGLSMPPYLTPAESAKVFARTVTFGKALGVAGAALIVPEYVKSYLINYARPFVFSTAPAVFNILAVDCTLTALEDGRASELALQLQRNIQFLIRRLREQLAKVPHSIAMLPETVAATTGNGELSPIIPVLTAQPHALSAHLRTYFQTVARPIAWPTVPKGRERVRICVTAGHSLAELEGLAIGVGDWVRSVGTDSAFTALMTSRAKL